MKTAAEVIEAISRLSASEQQEINEYIHELIAAEHERRIESSNLREAEKSNCANS